MKAVSTICRKSHNPVILALHIASVGSCSQKNRWAIRPGPIVSYAVLVRMTASSVGCTWQQSMIYSTQGRSTKGPHSYNPIQAGKRGFEQAVQTLYRCGETGRAHQSRRELREVQKSRPAFELVSELVNRGLGRPPPQNAHSSRNPSNLAGPFNSYTYPSVITRVNVHM